MDEGSGHKIGMNADDTSEAFDVYREGVALQLKWKSLPPLERQPASRICALDVNFLFLLTRDESLYTAVMDEQQNLLHLEYQRSQIVDVAFCEQSRQLFIVTSKGEVLMQVIEDKVGYRRDTWQTLSLDPLELSEEGIFVQRVCCSKQGVIFITRRSEVYVMGSCGSVFNGELHPKRLRLFDEGKEILDLAGGDEFFVVLLKRLYDEKDDPQDVLGKRAQNRPGPSSCFPSPSVNRRLTLEVEPSPDKLEINSNSSVRSFSSKSSHGEPDFDTNVQHLLQEGYCLLNTQVYTFGASNNGLLGTGDHIKRSSIHNVQKLDAIGVCSIAAGREHSIARSLAGRLFHWGLNGRQQLNGKKDLMDLSSPTELKLDSIALEESQKNILSACCGDFQTVLLNARGDVQEKDKQLLSFNKDFLTLQWPVADTTQRSSSPLLLASGAFTLNNRRQFQRHYHTYYHNLQLQLKLLLKYRHAVQMLQTFQQKTAAMALKQLMPVCQSFHKILYLLVASVKSFEAFYRSDFENPIDLLFVKYYRECIELFEEYTKIYCDIYSVDGYMEAGKLFAHLSSVPLMPDRQDEADLSRIFQQPFQVFPIFMQFLEHLVKSRCELTEHLLAWETLGRQNRIDMELAENTQDFWQRNERNVKIRHFRRRNRRVILTSTTVPLKLAQNAIHMSSPTFILFSDCLCQVGSQLLTYPLVVMWLKMEGDTSLRVVTPERSFTLVARTHHDKKLWYDQLESSIKMALGRPQDTKLSNVRTTMYVFSRNHSKYAGVHAYGRWRNGVLHGNCYLEYPDGKFYFGEMRNGEIEGYGKMVIPSVGLYEGTFKAGRFHGHGSFEMKDNEMYEGNFRDGSFHGHGHFRCNNYTYVGEYQANAKSGYGILDDMLTDDKYLGMFADNKRTGAGICITMNGDYFEGIYSNEELAGTGIAVFENGYYYEGELSMHGPVGKGTYYMPQRAAEGEDSGVADDDEFSNRQMVGNVLSGQLTGSWQDVRIVAGSLGIDRQFPKYPKMIGDLVVDNSRKWRSLFENFEEDILCSTSKKVENSSTSTKNLWSRIAIFMNVQRERERAIEQQDTAYQSTRSYFAKNISMGFSGSFDKLSLKSTNGLLTTAKSSILDLSSNLTDRRRSHSQETLYDADMNDFDVLNVYTHYHHYSNEENSINDLINSQLSSNWANDSSSMTSLRSSFDSVLNLSESLNNNSFSSQNGLDFVPSFGVTTLTGQDVAAIKEYLVQAFKDRHHPLYLLNQRIANCFYTSYGRWKVKPSPILAKQAMREWESISKRVYKFVRKMFPALPEDYCVIESSREVVSHITLLYPIVLSEGIYSTLFVLYANKYSRKDEMYRQNILYAEKLNDTELMESLSLDSSLIPVVKTATFSEAIQTLKQLQEKYSPKAMLTVIEKCMQLITDAHKMVESANAVILAADVMMPLTLFLVLRAAVPHLGAELSLLGDLTSGSNFQFEMNGLAGYCYTTLKASYEHITAKSFSRT